MLNLYNEVLLTRIGETACGNDTSSELISTHFKFAPNELTHGVTLHGRSYSASLAKSSSFTSLLHYLEWLRSESAPDNQRAAACAMILLPDPSGKSAVDYCLEARQVKCVQAMLKLAFNFAPAYSLHHLDLGRVSSVYPKQLGIVLKEIELRAYPHNNGPNTKRAPEDALTLNGKLRLAGWHDALSSRDDVIWDGLKDAAKEAAETAEVDVVNGFFPVAQLAIAPPRTGEAMSLFESLVATGEENILLSEPVRSVIEYKWEAYGKRLWYWEVVKFLVLFGSFLVGTNLLLLSSQSSTLGIWLYGVSAALSFVALKREYLEMRSAGRHRYLSDAKNVLDILFALLVLLTGVVIYLESVGLLRRAFSQQLASLASLSMLVPFTDVARGSERLSFLVDVLVTIGVDMLPFMVIVLFVMVILAFAFMLLTPDSSEFGTPVDSIFTAWKLYLLGDFEGDVYAERPERLGVFYVSTIVFNLIITNAVIALMGDSCEKTQEHKVLSSLKMKAKLLLDFERMMTKKELEDPIKFPKWIQ